MSRLSGLIGASARAACRRPIWLPRAGLLRLAAAAGLAAVTSADAAVFQYVHAWTADGAPLPATMGQAIDPATCRRVVAHNLEIAPTFGFAVDKKARTFRDPKSGIKIQQTCADNAALVETPIHPFAGAAPTLRALPCPAVGSETEIWFVFGQSIAGNYNEGRYTAGPGAIAYAGNGNCYQLGDPVTGGDGTDAGPWTRLADLMMGRKGLQGAPIRQIVVIERALGGTSVTDWSPGGSGNNFLTQQIRDAIDHGYEPTRIVYSQGEADANGEMTTEQWADHFKTVLQTVRDAGARAPVYVSQETICNYRTSDNPSPSEVVWRTPDYYVRRELGRIAIRVAQRRVVDGTDVRAGPDLDRIGPEMRADGCHMAYAGLVLEAHLWMEAFTGP